MAGSETSSTRSLRSYRTAALISLAYLALSLTCLLRLLPKVPHAVAPVLTVLLGPPAILLWGWELRNVYAFASLSLAIPFAFSILPGARVISFTFAALVWITWGFLSWAVSI